MGITGGIHRNFITGVPAKAVIIQTAVRYRIPDGKDTVDAGDGFGKIIEREVTTVGNEQDIQTVIYERYIECGTGGFVINRFMRMIRVSAHDDADTAMIAGCDECDAVGFSQNKMIGCTGKTQSTN